MFRGQINRRLNGVWAGTFDPMRKQTLNPVRFDEATAAAPVK